MNKALRHFIKIYEKSADRLRNILFKPLQSQPATNRSFSSDSNHMKVAVVGAAGKIGQPLCLLLKQSPLIDELSVHDVGSTSGFASELNHVDTNCKVTSFAGKENLPNALRNARVVVVLAAAPDSDMMGSETMWTSNAHVVRGIVSQVALNCPKALLAIGTNPVNSLVPMACELLRKAGAYSPNAVFGITASDSVRANTFVAQVQGLEPECVLVPVVGGHTEETIVPVLSGAKPCAEFTNEELENITMNIRKAQENMLKLKPPETAPLTNAFASARFVISLVKALRGYPEIIESAYVSSKVHPQLKYLSTPLLLGPSGVSRNLGVPPLSEFESCLLDNAVPSLAGDIKRGENFACGAAGSAPASPACDPCDGDTRAPPCPRDWCAPGRGCETGSS